LLAASKPEDADATLDITQSSYHGVVTGTLTLKSGELIWSDEYSGRNMRMVFGEEIAMEAQITGERLLGKLEKRIESCRRGYRNESLTDRPGAHEANAQAIPEQTCERNTRQPSDGASVPKSTAAAQAVPEKTVQAVIKGKAYWGAASNDSPHVRHNGVTLSTIDPGGPASQAGLKPGDTIISIEKTYLYTVEDLSNEIQKYAPGSRVNVRYLRGQNLNDTNVIMGGSDH
jgi:S1-C subfamily serine protease